jgi:site-specific DNA-methyltransferase (adenine-specific)
MNKGLFSSETDDRGTPLFLFNALNKEFVFDIDVCASKMNSKVKFYYDKNDDGLSKDWSEKRCWMNPPYGRKIKHWIKKAYESNTLVVGLLPARTDTSWFHNYIYGKAEIRFVRGRLCFNDKNGRAPFPSMIVVWRQR